jgi:SAM-dependent methyltransferase
MNTVHHGAPRAGDASDAAAPGNRRGENVPVITSRDLALIPIRLHEAPCDDGIVATPRARGRRAVLEGLDLIGDERVIDLGAGSGRDVAALLDRLPRGHLVALDSSESTLTRMRDAVGPSDAERLTTVRTDLADPLPNLGPADVVVSVGFLDRVRDHDGLFPRVWELLRPGGTFRAEWAGAGNPDHTAESTRDRLRRAGFRGVTVDVLDGVRLLVRARRPPERAWSLPQSPDRAERPCPTRQRP